MIKVTLKASNKFADDVTLVTKLENYNMIPDEIKNIENWALANNLTLNKAKTKKIIFIKTKKDILPDPIDGIARVTSFNLLGVTLQNQLSMKEHVDSVITKCTNMLYCGSSSVVWPNRPHRLLHGVENYSRMSMHQLIQQVASLMSWNILVNLETKHTFYPRMCLLTRKR